MVTVLAFAFQRAGAFMAVPSSRAQAAGLRCRPITETVADTLAWWQALPAAQQGFAATGLAPEREAGVLAGLRPV